MSGTPVRSGSRMMVPWLCAAFLAGALSCGVILRFAPDMLCDRSAAQLALAVAQTGMSAWVLAAVTYQRMYARDTVAFDAPNPATAAHTVERIRRDYGLPIRIPDLRAAGLTFMRIQRLTFDHKPPVQIVYLPENGSPVALCAMWDDTPDTAFAHRQVANM